MNAQSIPLEEVACIVNPFEQRVWVYAFPDKPMSREQVRAAIDSGSLAADPYKALPEGATLADLHNTFPASYHINRVAYLATHGWEDPIIMDMNAKWPIPDGNHRVAAAIFRGDSHISVVMK